MSTYAARTIPAEIRRNVIARDGWACTLCFRAVVERGSDPWRPDAIHLDHITPWAAGGQHTVENLRVTCADCNIRREKPRRVTQQAIIKVKVRDGDYRWPAGYIPPKVVVKKADLLSVAEAAELTGFTHAEILAAVARGELGARKDSPIRVRLPRPSAEQARPQRRRRAVPKSKPVAHAEPESAPRPPHGYPRWLLKSWAERIAAGLPVPEYAAEIVTTGRTTI